MPVPPIKKSCWVCLQPVDPKADKCPTCGQPTAAVCLNCGKRVKLHHEERKILSQVHGQVHNENDPDYLIHLVCGFEQLIKKSHLNVADKIAAKLLVKGDYNAADKLAREIKEGRKQTTPNYDRELEEYRKKELQQKILLKEIPPLLDKNNYSEAIQLYEKCLLVAPNNAQAKTGILKAKGDWCMMLLEEIAVLITKNDFHEAQTKFNQAEKIGSPKSAELKKTQNQIKLNLYWLCRK